MLRYLMDKEYEKLALIVVLSGCGLAIALALTTFICCQLFVKVSFSATSFLKSYIEEMFVHELLRLKISKLPTIHARIREVKPNFRTV